MDIHSELKKQTSRWTKPREEVLNTLSKHPKTAQEIYKELKENGSTIDLASVYRTLDLFVKINIIQEIDLGEGKKRYELIEKNHHHHHLVCNKCGAIEDIEMKEDALIKEVCKKSKFKVQKHKLEFFGLCEKCQ